MKAALLFASLAAATAAAVAMPPPLPSLREQEATQEGWLKLRLERVLPSLMRKHRVPMWLVVSSEYNEDPVFFSLVPPSVMAARRRTILVFHDRGGEKGVERIALGGRRYGGLYELGRDPGSGPELWGRAQWDALRDLVEERRPERIAVNVSHTHAFSDGLSAGEREQLQSALGPWAKRLAPVEELPIEYLAIRLPEMLPEYRHLMQVAHALIARAFSSEVVKPGRTTTADVAWWLREQVRGLGMGEWFPPTVTVQRRREGAARGPSSSEPPVIERGDHLHVDFGIHALGLATDTQHVGYVLRPGEEDAPAGLQRALLSSNRLQDLLLERLRPGRTGNEVLADTLDAMRAEGIDGTVYTHPIGDHGHGAGPLIGLWDRQDGVPGRGDLRVLPGTWFSIELQATTPVPEWDGQRVRSAQEEEAVLHEDGRMEWVLPRQSRYHLVR